MSEAEERSIMEVVEEIGVGELGWGRWVQRGKVNWVMNS